METMWFLRLTPITVQVKVTSGPDDGFSGGDVFDNTDTWY